MQWVVDITPFDRIIVDVLQLLPHHLIGLDLLRLTTLLPYLVLGRSLVVESIRAKLPQNRLSSMALEQIDDLSGRE
jgi:hypothetical protein